MYITKVISYNNAWLKLSKEHGDVYGELISVLIEKFTNIPEQIKTLNDEDFPSRESGLRSLDTLMSLSYQIERELNHLKWNKTKELFIPDSFEPSFWSSKDNILVSFQRHPNFISTFLFKIVRTIDNVQEIIIPIILVLNSDITDLLPDDVQRSLFVTFESIMDDLKGMDLATIVKNPFLICGLSFEFNEPSVIELDYKLHPELIEQRITFEPEYFQAGLGILSYFGTVLREKYPEQGATVKIEQQDLTVRMIVESENGDKEIIEKALHEYSLVVKGEIEPDKFYLSPIKVLELKTQLSIFQVQVESQRDIIALQNGQILDLKAIVDKALNQSQSSTITVINQLHNEQNIKIDYKAEINQSYEVIDELLDLLNDESIKNQLRDIQNALDNTKEKKTPEDLKDSSGFKKLGKFLKEAKDVSSNIRVVLDNTEKGVGLIEKLAKHYDKLAQFAQPFFS